MSCFIWDDHFETGLEAVDAQHRGLVSLMNRLLDGAYALQTGQDAPLEVFGQLMDYSRSHFAEEEAIMAARGIDPRFLEAHREQHRQYALTLQEARRTLLDQSHPTRTLASFVGQWLIYHILGWDQAMARQLRAMAAGASAQEAFEVEQSRLQETDSPLFRTLRLLVEQVLTKNSQLVELNAQLEQRIQARTRELQEAVSHLETEMAESRRLEDELSAANTRLEQAALTDVLTGLPNRRHAMDRLAQLWSESRRHGTTLACILLDADDFKQVNDRFGHEAGDLVLCGLASVLRDHVRGEDLVCRLGGDEFLILCAHTDLDGALSLAEHLRRQVEALELPAGRGTWKGSLSLGVAEAKADMASGEELIARADEGLYLAKRQGRNRVAVAPEHASEA
nr:diguanylate cyclase [uncultured Holophaga sp.]